jgi:thiamine-phosphate pyrophosphorylase
VLSERLKTIRHELAGALTSMGADNWVRVRDTEGDVGTRIHTAAERSRASVASLVAANCKRVEESLRTLEEYGKLQRSGASARVEALRYQFYTVEQALLARQNANVRLEHARLYLLLTDRLCPRGLGPVAHAAIAAGVDVIQLREKEVSDRRRIDLAKHVRQWTREAGVLFIVNDRPDVAALVDADGVHLGQDDLSVAEARRIVGTNKLIGVSTHTMEQAREAVLAGADYLGVGPVFASQTKEFHEFAGLDFVRSAAAEVRVPWFAIGGITEANIGDVMAAGATRVAVSSAICVSDTPQQATSELIRKLSADSVQ